MLTSQGGASMATLHSWLNTQPDTIAEFFVHVSAQRFYFTHIYIPFILSLFNYIQNNGELKCFESLLKSCEKALDCVNHVIYNPEGGASMATLHSRFNTQPDKISKGFFHVLAQRFYFTHIYIPFILSLFNYLQNNGEFRCF